MEYSKAIKIVYDALEKYSDQLVMTEEKIENQLTDLGIDSLDIMLVIMDIAEIANIRITDDQAEELNTAKKLITFISNDINIIS